MLYYGECFKDLLPLNRILAVLLPIIFYPTYCLLWGAPHNRHFFATHLIEQGVPIHAIQGFMGHNSITTTSIYLHLTREFSFTVKSPLDSLKDKFNPGDHRGNQ